MSITTEKLKAIEIIIDTMLDKETTETLTNWLINKRKEAKVIVAQPAVIKSVCGCKPMEYDVKGIRYFKCRICGEPMK